MGIILLYSHQKLRFHETYQWVVVLCYHRVYYRTPDIDGGYWCFIVFSNLLAIFRLPVLMGEIITMYPRTIQQLTYLENTLILQESLL
jgi:hypothetical protein